MAALSTSSSALVLAPLYRSNHGFGWFFAGLAINPYKPDRILALLLWFLPHQFTVATVHGPASVVVQPDERDLIIHCLSCNRRTIACQWVPDLGGAGCFGVMVHAPINVKVDLLNVLVRAPMPMLLIARLAMVAMTAVAEPRRHPCRHPHYRAMRSPESSWEGAAHHTGMAVPVSAFRRRIKHRL